VRLRLGSGMMAGDRGGTSLLVVLAAVAIAVPLLNQVVPSSSTFHLSATESG